MKPTKDNSSKWNMDKIITFDIEAYDWVNPVALGMYDGEEYTEFLGPDCIGKFVDEIMKRKYRGYRFVAHNGGNYDFGFIISEIIDRDYSYNFLEKNNSMFYIKINDSNGKNRYLQDSMELLMSSLGKIAGEFTDYEKLDFDLDKIDKLHRMSKEDINKMSEYLEIDCKSLYKSLFTFTDIIDELSDGKCTPQLTMGSTAINMFRTKFQREEIPQSFQVDNELSYMEQRGEYLDSIEPKIRESYFGGRTEVYKMYGENLKHYDVNSLFPHIYTNKKMPVGKPKHMPDIGRDCLDMTDCGGVAKITGFVPDIKIPVLPYRHTVDKQEKVLFPTGEISGWYTLAEIRYAIEVGALENVVVENCLLSRYGKPFKEYGETLYDMKKNIDKEKEPAKYWIVKLLLNSFYGKFALDREQSSWIRVDNPIKYIKENDTKLIPINEKLEDKGVFKEPQISGAKYIIPRIATCITSKARIEMHKWFKKIGYDNIWYCDTDSIVTDKTIETGEGLGEMDLENEIEKGYFLAPKVYAELTPDGKTRTKAKGMRNNPNPFYAFERALEDNVPELVSAQWSAPKGVGTAIKEDGKMVVQNQSRTLKQFDNKRNHLNNKNSVPININI